MREDRYITQAAAGAAHRVRPIKPGIAALLASLLLSPILISCAGTELPKSDAGVAPNTALISPAPAATAGVGAATVAPAAAPTQPGTLAAPPKPALGGASVAANAPPATLTPAPGLAGSASAVAPDRETIVGFKGRSVLLYNDPDSNDGQRMPIGAFSLPMTASRRGTRLEVQTSQGTKWVASSEVVVAGKTAPY